MPRVWMFKEIGEIRKAEHNEWYRQGEVILRCGRLRTLDEYSILSLQTFDSDPLEAIRVVYEKYKDVNIRDTDAELIGKYIYDTWQAIEKTMKEVGK